MECDSGSAAARVIVAPLAPGDSGGRSGRVDSIAGGVRSRCLHGSPTTWTVERRNFCSWWEDQIEILGLKTKLTVRANIVSKKVAVVEGCLVKVRKNVQHPAGAMKASVIRTARL